MRQRQPSRKSVGQLSRIWLLLPLLCLLCTGCPPAAQVNTAPAQPTTPSVDPLKVRLEAAIKIIKGRQLEPSHGFWTVFHGILGLGPDVTLLIDRKTNKKVKALDYVREGGEMPGLRFDNRGQGLDVFTATDTERFFAQGHQDQFVAEMAQWGVPLSTKFKVNGADFTFADFVRYTKYRASVTRRQELAWALLIVAEYEGTTLEWSNQFGETLKLEDIVKYELDSPMDPDEAIKLGQLPLSCGGTHRLYGLSWALHVHLQNGGKLVGLWKRVDTKLKNYAKTIKNIRNSDGSFSTNWLVKKGDVNDASARLTTSGHTFEWLALALSDKELREPWMEQSASYLAQLISDLQKEPVEGGALYHAVHGLIIYYARVYGTEELGDSVPYLRLAPGCKPVVRKQAEPEQKVKIGKILFYCPSGS